MKSFDDRDDLVRLVAAVLHRRGDHHGHICSDCFRIADEVVDVMIRALSDRALEKERAGGSGTLPAPSAPTRVR
jgi:hypothetical protein